MKMLKQNKYIYTLVLTKQKPYIIGAVISAFFLAFIGSFLMPENNSKIYNSVLKSCIDTFTLSSSFPDKEEKFTISVTAYDILGQVSPIFFDDETAPLFSSKKDDKTAVPQETVSAEPKSKVITKAVVSGNLDIKNETDYSINPHELANSERNYNTDGAKVLIIHTHGCETYSDKNGMGIGEKNSYRTTDNSKNMVEIGNVMAEVFTQNGIEVIHDKTLCDYPSYNSSYVKSLEVIEWHLKNDPNIKFVFDIHRDAIETQEGTPTKLSCKINGEDTAQAMIVCGTDAMGLDNPNWRENLILALKIQKNLEDMYPGFMRPLNIRKERFNMHKTQGSLLFEVGTHGNTLREAKNSAKLLAEGIVKTIKE